MRLMLDFCAAERLRCLDLTPTFRQRAAQGEQLYFRLDGHWNAAGHALAADLIYEYLAAQGLLPAP
jgi:oligoribonuclease NrnB/cAMP/cGMP phosphodiesterase (DHH superfamily)